MISEQTILETVRARLPDQGQNLTDDAFFDPETRQIFTTDLLVEGRHFSLEYFSPADLGWKAVAVNLSDIAAMGGEPWSVLVAMGLPNSVDRLFIQDLYDGIADALKPWNCQVIGGDTVASPILTVTVTAIGTLPVGHTPGFRAAVNPGDQIITTGAPGLSAVGLHALQHHWPGFEDAKTHHRRPHPRVREGLTLSKTFERYGLMDSSDGLADALLQLAASSQVGIVVEESDIPLHPDLLAYAREAETSAIATALYGGEDFELVAAIPTGADLPPGFTRIGEAIEDNPGQVSLWHHGNMTQTVHPEKTYQHFKPNVSARSNTPHGAHR